LDDEIARSNRLTIVTTVLLVGGDLMAKSRLVDATSQAGLTLESTTVEKFRERLQETNPSVVVLDLDQGREPALTELRAVRDAGELTARVVGYYSHVDRALGEAAEQAGCEPWPRGKFWGSLEQLLPPAH
jgi:DNA-binding NarL/FixJ family response regulator